MAISKHGKVFAWGRGHVGQTGLGIRDTINVPTCLEVLSGQRVSQVSCYAIAQAALYRNTVLRFAVAQHLALPVPTSCYVH